jgi:hypothetical protein
MNQSVRLAFCSMITALSTALLFLAGLIPASTYALSAFAGILLFPVVIELGTGWAVSVYVSAGLLSFLLSGDKEAALAFVLFFGFYPVFKARAESKKKEYAILAKAAYFNLTAIAEYWLGIYLLGVKTETLGRLGSFGPWVLLVCANVFFWIYDYAFSLLVVTYMKRYHRIFSKWLAPR